MPVSRDIDAANLWINLKLPDNFLRYEDKLNARKKMALNKYALAAYYLDPRYDNAKLDDSQNGTVQFFFLKYLDSNGLNSYDEFIKKTGVFSILNEKGIHKPLVYWSLAEREHPQLALLAQKLLKIPASSAQIERLFSNWSFIQPLVRNRLTFERQKKLVHIYYTLKSNEEVTYLFDESEEE